MKHLTTAIFVASLMGITGCATPRAVTQCPEVPAPTHDGADDASPRAEPSAFDARLSLFDYPYEVRTFEVEAQRQTLEMAYMVVEPESPNGSNVLLLHGKNFSGAYWADTARDLAADGFRVVIPDQIGFGKSSKPAEFQYSFASLATYTAGLLDSLGIETVRVVGHSMGGMLATRFALMFPERTEKLALVNPIGLEDWAEKVPYAPVETVYQAELKKTPEAVKEYMRQSYFDGEWKPEYDEVAAIQMGWSEGPDERLLAWVSALTADMIFTQPVVDDFPNLTVPTLLVIGTRDRTALGKNRVSEEVRSTLGRYEQLGKSARDAIPNAKLVEIEDVGHMPQIEAYDRYIEALRNFL